MKHITHSISEFLLTSGQDHLLLLDLPDVVTRWQVTLKIGGQCISSELILHIDMKLLIWRALLLEDAMKRKQFFFHVYGDVNRAMAFHSLATTLPFARLLLDSENGAFLEVAMPLPKKISEETFQFVLTEVLRAFKIRTFILSHFNEWDTELLPDDDAQEMPDMEVENQPHGARKSSQATGLLIEIDHAIAQGDIALARRLSRGEHINVPDSI